MGFGKVYNQKNYHADLGETRGDAEHVGKTGGSEAGEGAVPPSVGLGGEGITPGQVSWCPRKADPGSKASLSSQAPQPHSAAAPARPLGRDSGHSMHSVDIYFIEHLLWAGLFWVLEAFTC